VRFVKNLARLGALAFAGLLLWSCTVVVDEGPSRPRPLPPGGPRICTQEFRPVCAVRGGRERTFPNACLAQAEGFRPVHPGQCGGARPPVMPPQACTREFRPVCAVRGSRQQTFPNSCVAQAEGFRPIHPGQCGGGVRPPVSGGPRFCTREFAPVCGVRAGRMRTFGNSCEAEAANFRIIHRGQC